MKGSLLAKIIEADMRREKYWKHKVVRQKCYVDKLKQCSKCLYRSICEDVEYEGDNSFEPDKQDNKQA